MEQDIVDEVTSPLSASPSPWSMIELKVSRKPPSTEGRKRSSKSKISKTKRLTRPQAPLACLNCRVKKVKVCFSAPTLSITVNANIVLQCCTEDDEACVRCLKFDLRCLMPLEDERRFPCSKKVIRELQEKVSQLEEALRVAHAALRYQAQSDPNAPQNPTGVHWDETGELTSSPGTDSGPYFIAQEMELTPPLTERNDEEEGLENERMPDLLDMANERNIFLAEDFLYSSSEVEHYDSLGQ